MAELLRCEDLRRTFRRRGGGESGEIVAVDSVSFALGQGETLGIVGESGCGKSTLGRLLLRLLQPTAGSVYFDGQDIAHLGEREMRGVRRKLQAVFQNPYASLNPHFTISQILQEPYRVHRLKPAGGWDVQLPRLLEQVGLDAGVLNRRPAQLSGGQLQRVAVARALALEPKLIVADEPTSALDVSIQAQILNLLAELQERTHVSYLFISHNLNVVEHLSDRVAVMYLGRFVEVAPASALYARPLHPYTQALLSSVPSTDPEAERKRPPVDVKGEPPDPSRIPSGCPFHPRCPLAEPTCSEREPELRDVGTGHAVACHFAPERTEARGQALRNAAARAAAPEPTQPAASARAQR
jgi:oligopeptide/dipeptide ABC transporter ATP-binding protein